MWPLVLAGLGWAALTLLGETEQKRKATPMATTPKGGKVTRWASMVQAEIAKQKAIIKPSMVLATIEHESGGNPKAMSYYRKPKAPYNDPPMPKGLTAKEQRAFMVANWSGHAYGLGQLIPETGKQYGGIQNAGYTRAPGGQPGESYDPAKNIKGTVAFLDYLARKYGGDKRSVYAAYYAGAGNVAKHGAEHFATYIDASLNREAKYHAFDV